MDNIRPALQARCGAEACAVEVAGLLERLVTLVGLLVAHIDCRPDAYCEASGALVRLQVREEVRRLIGGRRGEAP